MGKIPSAFLFFFARMDGKPIDRKSIIRKALEAQHRAAFTIARAEAVEGDDRLVKIICATDKPITHFLWSKWDYADIQLAMNTKAMRSTRFENGAAFLMDHNTQDQRGVIEDFEISDGELRATVKMSRSERGQELLQDIRDGIRRQISLGFMIHALELIEERKKKGEPDLYEARDWEPYEASSVAVAADIDAKVMRAMNARRDGMETCPDCGQPIDDCTCEMPETCPDCGNPMAECSCDTTDSTNASRQQRAISPAKEIKTMTPEEIAAEEAKNKRSAEQLVRDEISEMAKVLGSPDLAAEFHQKRLLDEVSGEPTVAEFKAFARKKLAGVAPQVPAESPEAVATRAGVKIELARSIPRHGKITAFKGERAAETAYRFGQWLLGRALYDPNFATCVKAREFCESNGLVRAMGENTNEGGGASVPPEFSNDLIDLREMYGVFRRNAKIVPMNSDTLLIPRRTGGLTAYFVAEAGSITASDAAWDNVELVAKKLAVLARYSSEINQDSLIDFGNTMADEIAYAFANKEDDCGFNGDGSSTYGGITGVREKIKALSGTIANIAGLVVATGTGYGTNYASTVLTDFEAVVGKLPIYADTPRTKWYCHKGYFWNVMQKLSLAAGGNTEFNISNGSAPRFLGYDVEFVQVMPQVSAVNQVCALLGDLSLGARMGTRLDTSIAFSEHSRFANDQIEIRGTERFDINVHDVGNASATAALRVPGPIVGLITASS